MILQVKRRYYPLEAPSYEWMIEPLDVLLWEFDGIAVKFYHPDVDERYHVGLLRCFINGSPVFLHQFDDALAKLGLGTREGILTLLDPRYPKEKK